MASLGRKGTRWATNCRHVRIFNATSASGPRFNIKMSSYQYSKSHCGDKTVVRSSYLHNGISYTGKMTSLYWIRAQIMVYGVIVVWKVNIRNANYARATAFIFNSRTCRFFYTNISTRGVLQPPTFGFMPNALTIWPIETRHFLSHALEHWLRGYRYFCL